MSGLDKILSFTERVIGGLFLLVMSVVCLIQVIFRFTALPLYWTEELARYIFAWVIYIGCAAGLQHDAHFSVDVLQALLPKKAKMVQKIFVQVVCIAGSAILFHYCLSQISIMLVKPSYSQAAHINMLFPYSAPAVCMVLMILRGIYKIYFIIQEYKKETAPQDIEIAGGGTE